MRVPASGLIGYFSRDIEDALLMEQSSSSDPLP
jgi:hypothetical protein